MKTIIASIALLLIATSAQAQTVIYQGSAGKTSSSGMIAAEKGPERYGGHHVSSSYSYWYSYSVSSPTTGMSRLERGLYNQGRRIEGF